MDMTVIGRTRAELERAEGRLREGLPGQSGSCAPMVDIRTATQSLRSPLEGYAPEQEHRPLGGYTVLSAIFGACFAGGLAAAHRAGRPLPAELSVKDIVLTGIATHKLSRLIAKDRVTSAIRAPFTRYEEPTGYGEIAEQPRGEGLRLAIGELLVCPYCLAQWIAGAFAVGHVAAPRLTRLLASMWTAHALADAAQLAYSAAEKRV
jgi:hypothetical protein